MRRGTPAVAKRHTSFMTSLYDAAFGKHAVIRSAAGGLLRRVRHGDVSFTVDAGDEVGLVLNLSEAHRVEGEMAGLVACGRPRVGSVTVMPPNCWGSFTIRGECRILQLRLPWSRMVSAAGNIPGVTPDVTALRPRLNEYDPTLARLFLAAAVAGDDADGAIESVASYLLAGRVGRAADALSTRSGGIAPARLARVLHRIEADTDGSTSLAALADEAGMSLFHFAREFARTVGVPPHDYVVRRRVDRAIVLLSFPALTVADVAHRAGFADASHLARHMRRITGTTPKVFRSRVLP